MLPSLQSSEDFSRYRTIRSIADSDSYFTAAVTFCENVISQKKAVERAREKTSTRTQFAAANWAEEARLPVPLPDVPHSNDEAIK